MRPRLGVLFLIGVLLLAGCGSSSALDDAAIPAASASGSASASVGSASATARPSSASPEASATPAETREAATPSQAAPTSRTLEILIGTDPGTGSFAWDSGYSACPGVAWGGVTGGSPGGTVSIDVSAGDGACAEAAQWLAGRADTVIGTNRTVTTSGPGDLTYAFSGTLTIDGTAFPLVIGQSADGTWWIGGEAWDSGPVDGEACTNQVWNGTELVMYAFVVEGASQFTVIPAGVEC